MAKITRVVAVANRKGGVGKSTTAMLLATALAKEHRLRVAILDCDEQQSVTDTATMEAAMYPDDKPAVEVRAMSPVFVRDFLQSFGRDYDVVFIDPPRITESQTSTALGQLLALCDCVLIPLLGSQLDAVSTMVFVRMVKEIATFKHENGIPFQYYGFINRRGARKDNAFAAEYMAETGLKMFDTQLNDLKVFATPSVYFSVLETADGRRRFESFFTEFCKRFKIK